MTPLRIGYDPNVAEKTAREAARRAIAENRKAGATGRHRASPAGLYWNDSNDRS